MTNNNQPKCSDCDSPKLPLLHILCSPKGKTDHLQDKKHTWSCKLLAPFINHSDKERRRNLHTAGLTRLSSSFPLY